MKILRTSFFVFLLFPKLVWASNSTSAIFGSNIGNTKISDSEKSLGQIESQAKGLQTGEIKWKFHTELAGGGFLSSPAIGLDGTIYVGSRDGRFYAVNGKSGQKIWEYVHDLSRSYFSSPAIGTDGTVYVAATGSNHFNKGLYAFNCWTGAKIWEFDPEDTNQHIVSGGNFSPAIGVDGTVYATSTAGRLYAINGKTGKKVWVSEKQSWNNSAPWVSASPVIAFDGTVFAGSTQYGPTVSIFAPKTGKIIRQIGGNGPFILGSDGTVYAANSRKLHATDGMTGKKIWEFEGTGSFNQPVIASDGTIYAGTAEKEGKLYAIEGKTGKKLWHFETDGHVQCSPAISFDGTIYFGSGRTFHAVNGKTGKKLWSVDVDGEMVSSPAIGSDGTVYVGTGRGTVYALSGGSGPANSPWPMFGQNAMRTGRAPSSGQFPAYFEIKVDSVGGAVSGGGTYRQGDSVEILATAGQGNVFAGWEDDALGMTNPLKIVVDSDLNITANFNRTSNETPPKPGDVIALSSPDGAVVGGRGTWSAQSENLLAVSTSLGTNLYEVGVDGRVSFLNTISKSPMGYGQNLSLFGDLLVIGRMGDAAYVYRIQADKTVDLLGEVTPTNPSTATHYYADNTALSHNLLAVSDLGEGVVDLYRISEGTGVTFVGKVRPPPTFTPMSPDQSEFGTSISLSENLLAVATWRETFLYKIETDGNATCLSSTKVGEPFLSGNFLSIAAYREKKVFLHRVESNGSITEIQQVSTQNDYKRTSITNDILVLPPKIYRFKPDGEILELANLAGFLADPHEGTFKDSYALGANFLAAGGKVYFDPSWTPTVMIDTVSVPYAGGTVTGGGKVFQGKTATLTAIPSKKHVFVGWEGDYKGKENPLVLKANENLTVIANFRPATESDKKEDQEEQEKKEEKDDSPSTPPPFGTPLEGAPGWWTNNWLGSFYLLDDKGWIYHPDMGWLYLTIPSDGSTWLWKEGIGWIWTEAEVYPFLYSSVNGDWLYFSKEPDRRTLLFEYGISQWREWAEN